MPRPTHKEKIERIHLETGLCVCVAVTETASTNQSVELKGLFINEERGGMT